MMSVIVKAAVVEAFMELEKGYQNLKVIQCLRIISEMDKNYS